MPERTLIVDHVALLVRDLAAARRFYAAALVPLGYRAVGETADGVGFGLPGGNNFWLYENADPNRRAHVAFAAPDRAAVDAFHRAALAAGGRDNGPPALHPEDHPSYYAAFVLDAEDNNIEAVHHGR